MRNELKPLVTTFRLYFSSVSQLRSRLEDSTLTWTVTVELDLVQLCLHVACRLFTKMPKTSETNDLTDFATSFRSK